MFRRRSKLEGDYVRAEALDVRVVLMLIETFAVGSGPRWWRNCAS